MRFFGGGMLPGECCFSRQNKKQAENVKKKHKVAAADPERRKRGSGRQRKKSCSLSDDDDDCQHVSCVCMWGYSARVGEGLGGGGLWPA